MSAPVQQAPGLWRTDLPQHDLSVPRIELVQSRVELSPEAPSAYKLDFDLVAAARAHGVAHVADLTLDAAGTVFLEGVRDAVEACGDRHCLAVVGDEVGPEDVVAELHPRRQRGRAGLSEMFDRKEG